MREYLVEQLNKFFTERGFKKKGKGWYISKDKAIIIAELQASVNTKAYFLNFGIYFSFINPTKKKPSNINDWHFESRYNQLINSLDPKDIWLFYDINEDILENKIHEISQNINSIIIPFLFKISDLTYLNENFPENFNFNQVMIKNVTKDEFINHIKNTTTGASVTSVPKTE